MNDPRTSPPCDPEEEWRTPLAERTRRQEASRRTHGRWVVGIAAFFGLAAAAWLVGPADNRAAIRSLWAGPAATGNATAPSGTTPAADLPRTGHNKRINQQDLQFAAELIDFLRPRGSGAK